MPSVPFEVLKESYLLKSTFFYNKLRAGGYFQLFAQMQSYSKLEGAKLNWAKYPEWRISESAWEIIKSSGIDPVLAFAHPKVIQLNPATLKYYRSVAMLPQKGLIALARVGNVPKIENGAIEAGKLPTETVIRLVSVINEVQSLVLTMASDISTDELRGMMYATAGTNIEGSWRNSIGAEGERVIKKIIVRELIANGDVSSFCDKKNRSMPINELGSCDAEEYIDNLRSVNLVNGYTLLFSSEPDIVMYDDTGAIVGAVEIKAGLDPSAALERLGAMLKSFENTLAEYPNATTILIASCITDEVEARLSASMTVRQKYVTTQITSSDSSQRKFANRIRKVLNLV